MRKYVIASIVLFLLIATSIYGTKKIFFSGVNKWSEKTIVETIVRSKPILVVDEKPVIAVSSVSMPEKGWYVATIRSINDEKAIVPVKVLLTDNGQPGIPKGELIVLLGPDIFDASFKSSNPTIPKSVIVELQK